MITPSEAILRASVPSFVIEGLDKSIMLNFVNNWLSKFDMEVLWSNIKAPAWVTKEYLQKIDWSPVEKCYRAIGWQVQIENGNFRFMLPND